MLPVDEVQNYLAHEQLLLILKLGHSLLQFSHIRSDTLYVVLRGSLEQVLHFADVHRVGSLVTPTRTFF